MLAALPLAAALVRFVTVPMVVFVRATVAVLFVRADQSTPTALVTAVAVSMVPVMLPVMLPRIGTPPVPATHLRPSLVPAVPPVICTPCLLVPLAVKVRPLPAVGVMDT